jgi:hypothetical protein
MLVEWSREGRSRGGSRCPELSNRASDAWARRELAIALSKSNQHEEALREATEARIEPQNSFSFSILGHVHQRCGKLAEATPSSAARWS